jgi:hypothetical protein
MEFLVFNNRKSLKLVSLKHDYKKIEASAGRVV